MFFFKRASVLKVYRKKIENMLKMMPVVRNDEKYAQFSRQKFPAIILRMSHYD